MEWRGMIRTVWNWFGAVFLFFMKPAVRFMVYITGENYRIQRWGLKFMSGFYKDPSSAVNRKFSIGSLRAEYFSWKSEEKPRVILFLHGGGFSVGCRRIYRRLCTIIAKESNAKVLLAGYRQAPEHCYPAAHEDSLAGYEWLLGQGVSPDRIIVMGDSAGGNLTACLMQTIKARGLPMPAAGVLMSPWLDMTMSGKTIHSNNGKDPLLNRSNLNIYRDRYASCICPDDPCISPVFGDMSGHPPLLVQVGECEVLLDDSVRYVENALRSGVDARLEIWPGMIHVWHLLGPFIPQSDDAVRKIGEFCRARVPG